MNKIFKVIWSKARGCYVVAHEFAKSHTKGGRAMKALSVAVAAALTLGLNGMALAEDDSVNDNTAVGVSSTVAAEDDAENASEVVAGRGKGTAISGTVYKEKDHPYAKEITDVAIGMGAEAYGDKEDQEDGTVFSGNATAVGHDAKATAYNAVAIGHIAEASGKDSVALGVDSEAAGDGSVAVGTNAEASGKSGAAFGNSAKASGDYSTALGITAEAQGESSTAVGNAAKAQGESSTALGVIAQANGANSVALGNSASATATGSTALSSNSKASGDYSIAAGWYAEAAKGQSIALGFRANASDDSSMAIGDNASASGSSAIALGSSSSSTGYGSIAIGRGTEAKKWMDTAVGLEAKALGGGSLALGSRATANSENNVALGANSTDEGGVGGYSDFEGDYVFATSSGSLSSLQVELSSFAGTEATGTVSIGSAGSERTLTNVAAGMISATSTDAINGSQLYAVAEALNDKVDSLPNQLHTVNGNDGEAVSPSENGEYNDEGNLLINKTTDDDGNVTYDISLNKKIDLGDDGSVTIGDTFIDNSSVITNDVTANNFYAGDTVINNNGITIGKGDKNIVINNDNVSFGDRVINNVVTKGDDKYEVVNIEYLENYVTNEFVSKDIHVDTGKEYNVTDNTVTIDMVNSDEKLVINDVASAEDVKNIDNRVTNIEGNITNIQNDITVIDNRVTNIEGDIVDIKGDITDIKGDITNIEGDIIDIKGDITNINNRIDDVETLAAKHTEVTVNGDVAAPADGSYTDGNLQLKVTDVDGQKTFDIKMNNNLDLTDGGSIKFGDKDTYIDGDSVNVGGTKITNNKITVGDNVTITDNSVKVGDTTINNDGLTINEGPTITKNNVDMNNQQIHNVAAGTEDTDAVNVSQLKELNQQVDGNTTNINNLYGHVGRLDRKINKVGAGAAALAALHPLDFDPDDKLHFSAGVGHYSGETAAAIGAFYQPNDDTLFSLGGTVGNGEDMVNVGVSWRFGQSSHQSRSKKAMAKEIIELRTEVAELKAMVYSLTGYGLDLEKSKLFPDTPENHWAYDYVAVVAGNGILEGYPDGYFDGDRSMTRYEMAAVVYRLLQKGVQVDNRMIQEFAPELARVRVDTLTHYNDGTPHIQRVRVIEGRG